MNFHKYIFFILTFHFLFQIFSIVEKETPKFRHKVTGIAGDIAAPGLALSPEDREKITQEVGIVFHGAATVRFDEKLKNAFNINIRGTREMLLLAKDIQNLKVSQKNIKYIYFISYKQPT